MRRRILVTVVLVATFAVTLLFVPAALAIRSRDRTAQALEAERDAAIAAAAIPPGDPLTASLPTDDDYGLYGRDGRLTAGRGPAQAEPSVLAAFRGGPTLTVERTRVIAAVALEGTRPPLLLRVSEPRSEAEAASGRRITTLGIGALLIVAAAIAAAWVLASRLARPVEALGRAAARLDQGDLTATATPSGIPEVDQVAGTLAHTGARIQQAMERERAFSADASHQLRTPLAAMRTAVEAEQLDPRADHEAVLVQVLGQIDRLEDTLTSLLALARDTHGERSPIELGALLADAADRWAPPLAQAGRRLEVVGPPEPRHPTVARAALDHVLDVLLDNAVRHGEGTVLLEAEAGVEVRLLVRDEGRLRVDPGALFDRRSDRAAGLGIGLHLARALIEAEGGRLALDASEPTTFAVTLPPDPHPDPGPDAGSGAPVAP